MCMGIIMCETEQYKVGALWPGVPVRMKRVKWMSVLKRVYNVHCLLKVGLLLLTCHVSDQVSFVT